MTFNVTGDHGKVQDSPLQRTRCQHARIVVLLWAAWGQGLAALQLNVALQTVHRHVHATLRLKEVPEEDASEATVVADVPWSRCLCTRFLDQTL